MKQEPQVELLSLYHKIDEQYPNFAHVYLRTSKGNFIVLFSRLELTEESILQNALESNDVSVLKQKYGNMYIDEIRTNFDGDMYFLLSKNVLLVVETDETGFHGYGFYDDIFSINTDLRNHYYSLEPILEWW